MTDIEYWVMGGAFAICGASFFFVVAPLYAWRQSRAGTPPCVPVGPRNTTGMGPIDILGVGAFFGIYAGMWLLSAVGSDPGAENAEAMDATMMLVGGLLMQAMLIGFAVMMLFWRVNMVDLFGLRYRQWWLPLVLGLTITVLMFTMQFLLHAVGYNDWITGLMGGQDGTQEAVKLMKESGSPLTTVLMILMACIGAPLSEEIVFRGYVYGAVKKMGGVVFAMLFSALFFSVVHMNLPSLLPLFVLGLALAAVYELTGSLWAPIAVHFCFNSASTLLIQLSRINPEWFEEAMILP